MDMVLALKRVYVKTICFKQKFDSITEWNHLSDEVEFDLEIQGPQREKVPHL